MYADRGGTPTSGPPFDHYEAKPSTMYSRADEILGKGKSVEGVGDSVVAAQRPAAAARVGSSCRRSRVRRSRCGRRSRR